MKTEKKAKKNQQKTKQNKDKKKQISSASYSESVRAKWFCCASKVDFVKLIFKAFLVFKLNLELALSIIKKKSIRGKVYHVLW